MDDCSSDGGPEIALRYGWEDPVDPTAAAAGEPGAAAARKPGLEEAAGQIHCVSDSDDLWKKDRLSAELAFMKVHQGRVCIQRL